MRFILALFCFIPVAANAYDTQRVSFPLFFVFQRAAFMLPVFPSAEC